MKICLILIAMLVLAGNAFAATTGIIFTDNFDNGVNGSIWAAAPNNSYNQNLNGDTSHRIGDSGQAARQEAADPWIYNSASTSSAFTSPGLLIAGQKQILTGYMWDDNVQSGTFAGGLMLAGWNSSTSGFYDYLQIIAINAQSTTNYAVRTNSTGYKVTSIARTQGWHKFQIVVDQYTGSNDVSFYIDDVLATTGNRKANCDLNQIRIGASVKTPASPFWYDNVKMEVVPEPASLLAMLTGLVGTAGVVIRRNIR